MRSKVIDERPTCRGATEEIPGDVVKCSDAEERHGTERSRFEGVDPGEAGRNPGRGAGIQGNGGSPMVRLLEEPSAMRKSDVPRALRAP